MTKDALFFGAALFFFAAGFPSIEASQPSTASLVALNGHRPSEFARLQAVADMDPAAQVHLAIGLPLQKTGELQQRIEHMRDRSSPDFGRHLTRDEFVAQYGPSQAQYDAAIAYARAHGLKVTATYPNRLLFDATGSVAAVEKVFHVKMRLYPHPKEKRLFFAPDQEPSIDPQFPILDIGGLDNFSPPHPLDLKIQPLATNGISANVSGGAGPFGTLIGNDFRNAYVPGVTLNGYGQAIAIASPADTYYPSDITTYEQIAGLPSVNITNVSVNGYSTTPPAPGGDDGETSLDIHMAMSMAPAAKIMVYEGDNLLDVFNQIASDDAAKQVSDSYGQYPIPDMVTNILVEMLAQGQSLFIASGDGGSLSNNQYLGAWPAGLPQETICGGTVLTLTGQGGGRQSETTWNGSGGGWVTRYPGLPSFQQAIDMSTNGGSYGYRNTPDVAAAATGIFGVVFGTNAFYAQAGTSAAAPLWAGFMALVNEAAADNGMPPVANFNQTIYQAAESASYAQIFNDITTGNNTNSASPNGFFAVPGYDLCTGWGTPVGSNLIPYLTVSPDTLQIAPRFGFSTTVLYGQSAGTTNTVFTLSALSSLSWQAGNVPAWLNLSATSGSLSGGSTQVTASLNPTAAATLPVGTYNATVNFTNVTTKVVKSRLFVLTVSAAAQPLALTGFNASVVVPASGTASLPEAMALDTLSSFTFYAAGLPGSTRGLPATGRFVSGWDGQTVFQFAPYGSADALLLGRNFSSSGTLTLSPPQALNSLTVLAASTYGTGSSQGTMTLNYSNGGHASFPFNAQDWFNTTTHSALRGVGRIILNGFTVEDDGNVNPALYQTTLPLAALGITQTIASITFTAPADATNTAIFAVSGVTGALSGLVPTITQQPQSLTNFSLTTGAAFTVGVSGAPPFSYQWYSNSVPLAQGMMPMLGFDPGITTNDAATYFVVVSNQYGSVQSASATLSVHGVPQFTEPSLVTNYTIFAGATISLTATASSAAPIVYAWEFNGAAIPNATQATLTLGNLQTTNSGTYLLVASTAYGSATNAAIVVNVLPPPSPYAQAVMQLNPLAYWRLDETNGSVAYDYAGGDNGFYTNVMLGQPGDGSASGLGTEPAQLAAQFGPTNGAQSYVSLPGLDLSAPQGVNAEFAIAAWVKASSAVPNAAGIVAKGYGNGDEEFGLACGANSNAFQFFIRNALGYAVIANSSVVPDNQWHLLVGVCDEINASNNAMITLYIDGKKAAQALDPVFGFQAGIHHSSYQASIGARASNTNSTENLQFVGLIDDVAIFTNALKESQVAALYGAANAPAVIRQQPQPNFSGWLGFSATNSVTASGTNLSYQWHGPHGAISGATRSTLILSNLSYADGGNYFVVVSNPFVTVQSANARLTVLLTNLAPYPTAVLALHPLSYWRLNETTGNVAFDFMGADNGGYTNTILGLPGSSASGTEPSELAALFGPTNGAQSCVSLSNLDLSVPNGGNGAFAIAAWVKASNNVPSAAGIVAKGYGGGDEEFGLACGNGNDFQFFVRNAQSGAASVANSSVAPDNNWHLLVGVCDQANSKINLYVDGTNAAQAAIISGTGIHFSSYQGSIGARASSNAAPEDLQFLGEIDDVAVFTNTLDATTVESLYDAAELLPPQLPPVVVVIVGAAFTNHAYAAGLGLSYQWFGPAGAMLGATNSTLILNYVTDADAGNYHVVVSDPFASVQSSSTVLMVRPAGQFASAYDADAGGATNLHDGSQLFSTALGTIAGLVSNPGQPPELQLTALQTTYDPNSVTSALELPDLNPGKRVYAFSAKWNSQVYGNTGIMIDGFSLNFGQLASLNLTNGAVESGYSTGLCFSVQTDSANGYTGYYVLRANSNTLATVTFNQIAQWGYYSSARHFWEVDWNYTNGMSVWEDHSPIFTNVATPGFVPQAGDRFVWAARSGGAYEGYAGAETEEVRLANVAVVTGGNLAAVPAQGPYLADTNTLAANPASNVFAANPSGPWQTSTNSGYVGATTLSSVPLMAYALESSGNTSYDPQIWALQGSSDGGVTWSDVASTSGYFLNGNETRAWLATNSTSTYGAYRLNVATNNGGADTALLGLTLYQFTPVAGPFVFTEAASQVSLVSAQLNGQANGGGVATVAWFNWGTSSSYGNTTVVQSSGSANTNVSFSATASGLTPGVTYHYQGVISNQFGVFAGSDATFRAVVNPVVFGGTGLGWSSNQLGGYITPAITNNVLRLTDGASSAARSVFFQQPQYIGAFKSSFTYQDVGGGGADGAAFVLQNDPRGTAALGGIGGSLGLGITNPITSSAALELNIYNGSGQIVGYTFLTNGLTAAGGANGNYHAPGAVNFASGHPINVALNYASGQLALAFTDTVSSASFTTNLNVGNLTNLVGGATAYVGFTGADGGIAATQIITNFSFVSIPTQTLGVAAGQVTISWPAAIAGFMLQQNTSLATTNWINVTNLQTTVNGQNQIVVPASPMSLFYRLVLP